MDNEKLGEKDISPKKKRNYKEYIRKIVLLVCIGVFIYSAYNLINILLTYQKIDNENNDLRDTYVEIVEANNDKSYMIIAWDELKKRNEDVVAWVHIPDTNINYPVLKGATNDTYLRHTIDKKYSIAGCIFVDSNNVTPFEDDNTIIYGHNMKNESMFSDINKYLEKDFGKEHPYVYIYLPDGTVSTYKIDSAHEIDGYSDLYTTTITDRSSFYKKMLEGNTLETEFNQDSTSPMIMLSTCATYDVDDPSRVVIHASLEKSRIDPKTEKME